MSVQYSTEKVFGQSGDLIRAKRDRNGDVVLYVDAIALDYADQQQGIKEYLNCFRSMQTLYVRRDLINGYALAEWAKEVGFVTTLLPSDMHVTIAFSRAPVDWSKAGTAPQSLIIPASNDRSLLALGIEKDAIVLKFVSSDLKERWQQFRDIGASWDWPDYQSHVTITFKGNGINFASIDPYAGPLVFGPEVFQEVKEDWKSGVEEKYSEDQPRDDDGKWTDGGGGDSSSNDGGSDGGGESSAPLDIDGNPLVDMNGTPLKTNNDGSLTLYHRTSKEAAEEIVATGKFKSKENTDETFFSSHPTGYGESYGTAVIIVHVMPNYTRINDAFRDGEVHVAVSNKLLSKKNIVGMKVDP